MGEISIGVPVEMGVPVGNHVDYSIGGKRVPDGGIVVFVCVVHGGTSVVVHSFSARVFAHYFPCRGVVVFRAVVDSQVPHVSLGEAQPVGGVVLIHLPAGVEAVVVDGGDVAHGVVGVAVVLEEGAVGGDVVHARQAPCEGVVGVVGFDSVVIAGVCALAEAVVVNILPTGGVVVMCGWQHAAVRFHGAKLRNISDM